MQYQIIGKKSWSMAAGLTIASSASAVGFDHDDFVVSSGFDGGFSVFDHDFTYKGELGNTTFNAGFGMDFTAEGRLAVRGILSNNSRQIAVFEPDGSLAEGVPQFVTSPPGVLDLKIAPNGNYIGAGQDAVFGEPNGLLEIQPDGTVVRQLDAADYEGVAVLPNGVVLGGGASFRGFLKAFDIATGELVYSVIEPDGSLNPPGPYFDEGQRGANSMVYSHTTDTVLVADRLGGRIYERSLDGQFIRNFDLPEDAGFFLGNDLLGVTRGSAGDVFAVFDQQVLRWSAGGDWIETTPVPELGSGYSWNIVWAGNAPGVTFLEGDYNGDGFVSQADLDLVLLNWGDAVVPSGWVAPDIFDGNMSQNELDGVLLNWGNGAFGGHGVVPEPAGLTLLGVPLWLAVGRER